MLSCHKPSVLWKNAVSGRWSKVKHNKTMVVLVVKSLPANAGDMGLIHVGKIL